MNNLPRLGSMVLGLGMLGACELLLVANENQSWFFRVVSDQPTQILSINRPATVPPFSFLTWSNSVAGANATVEIKYGLHGVWHTNTVTEILQVYGHVVSASARLSYVPGEIIVGFKDPVTVGEATALLESYALTEMTFGAPQLGVAALVRVPIDSELEWISRMSTNSIVKFAQPNYLSSLARYSE